ncbi:MAG: TRIC cation channel family protein, partial [Thermaurantiacus tibetensis]
MAPCCLRRSARHGRACRSCWPSPSSAGLDWIGGGTLRDLQLGPPVFCVREPAYLMLCVAASAAISSRPISPSAAGGRCSGQTPWALR